jgi:RNA polymerase sigma-70 factor (ECF subfamily)
VADSSIGFDLDSCVHTGDLATAASDESVLLERLRLGDESAYETLIARFQHPVYSLVYRLMTDPCEACDVVQEVFLKVFRNVHSFRGQSSLKTWIYRIAVNEASNHRRWFSRHRKQEVGLEVEEEGNKTYRDTLPDNTASPFETVLNQEKRVLIEQALAAVNPIFRSAVVLRDLEDLSYEEIAEVLQVSLGTVKSRILRGREALRRSLAGQLDAAENSVPEARPVAVGVK